jgi:hypothetical protein
MSEIHTLSSKTAEHYTPAHIVELVRKAMGGGIDCDPCSCAEAQQTVKAETWYSKEDDGLTKPWHGRVFINPPGDKRGALPKAFWCKLANEVVAGHVKQFVWLAFNCGQLRSLQSTPEAWLLGECELCIPRKRICFTGNSPTRDNAILGWATADSSKTWFDEFVSLGACWGVVW